MNFSDKWKQRILYSHVLANEAGMPLAEYLAAHFPRFNPDGWTREIRAGRVRVDDRAEPPETCLREHECVAFFPGELPEPEANLHFRVVYEDADLLVIDKPGDLCVHPSGPFYRHTLWHLLGGIYGEVKFVNRLDRETSGLLCAARNTHTAAAMDNHLTPMHKEYTALVIGHLSDEIRARGHLTPDLKSVVAKKKHFVFDPDAAPDEADFSDTLLQPIHPVGADMTLVRAIPFTGRQHQIRATLFSLGFPLAGDKLYGPDERIFLKIRTQTISPEDYALLRMKRQALHSALLEFVHPGTGEKIRCVSPLPPDFPRE